MNNSYIVLIDYSNGSFDYRDFKTYAQAKKYIEIEVEPNKYIEYAQIVEATPRYGWSNPDCCPEQDFLT